MGLLDTIKNALKGKGDQVSSGIDKAADVVDEKTGGQHTEKIDDAAEKAKDIVDKLDEG
jgi:MT0933-like antitoxin protein